MANLFCRRRGFDNLLDAEIFWIKKLKLHSLFLVVVLRAYRWVDNLIKNDDNKLSAFEVKIKIGQKHLFFSVKGNSAFHFYHL